ncbi:MAG: hypothetical protein U0992_02545 [Planctomycetaceae bacterium]
MSDPARTAEYSLAAGVVVDLDAPCERPQVLNQLDPTADFNRDAPAGDA